MDASNSPVSTASKNAISDTIDDVLALRFSFLLMMTYMMMPKKKKKSEFEN